MERPSSLTALGATHLVFGVLSLAWGLWGLVSAVGLGMMSGMASTQGMAPPAETAAMMAAVFSPARAVFTGAVGALRLLAGGGLIGAGIGLLTLKPWARTLSIVYVVYGVIMAIGVAVGHHLLVMGPVLSAMAKERPEDTPAELMMAGAVCWGVVLACLKLIYPAIVLILMFAPDVKTALHPGAAHHGEPPLPMQEG